MKNRLSQSEKERDRDFPARGSSTEQWKFLLQSAILAPSIYNTQPWLFHIRYTFVEIYADRRRAVPVVDREARYLMASCGCTLFNLKCAMRHYNCLGEVEVLPGGHPDLVARVHFGSAGEDRRDGPLLFSAISKRRTCRRGLGCEPVSAGLMDDLIAAGGAEGAWLHFFLEEEDKVRVARLVFQAEKEQWNDAAYRKELAKWVHTNHGSRDDGIPDYALPDDDLFSYPEPQLEPMFDAGDGEAARHHDMAASCPLMALLGCDGDSVSDWVRCGEALEHVLLRAAAAGVYASFMNQPLANEESRMKLALLSGNAGFAQQLFRLGSCEPGKPTPRRMLDEMLT